MKNDAIAGRMPGFKFDTAATFGEITAMVDELASAPPGHERANQIAQQIKSKLDGIGSEIGEMQPDADVPLAPIVGEPVKGPAVTDEGANFAGPVTTHEAETERQLGAVDRSGEGEHDFIGAGHNFGDSAPEVVEMEKKIGGKWLAVTAWASSAENLEADGWKRASDPRPVEEHEEPVGDKLA